MLSTNDMARAKKNPKRKPVRVAAIVPARGGKQSIPYKNLQEFGGKTLLEWAVDVAFQAEKIDVVIVSTEDKKIAAQAEKLGALAAPRPKKYSQPTSGDAGFYHHAVTWMEEEFGWKPELLVNLRPTSPLRFPNDIDNMIAHMLKNPRVDGIKSIVPTPLHPYKMWWFDRAHHKHPAKVGSAGKLELLADFKNNFRKLRGPDQPRQQIQKIFPIFFQDGQVDITRRKYILRPECLKYDNVWGENLHGYVLDPSTSTDLDDKQDFIRAEKIYRSLKRRRGK